MNRDRVGLRPVKIQRHPLNFAEGSALISMGRTRVLCAATVETGRPRWMERSDPRGWVTAEYGMLPRSTLTRTRRDRAASSGRTQEISRLIGRSLRAVTDLGALGDRTVTVDCDVLEADGGTRTAAITGAWVALHLACRKLLRDGLIERHPLRDQVAAVSVGVCDGKIVLDLDYALDSSAEVDLNVVMTGSGGLVEVQGTAEREPFSREQLDAMLDLAGRGIKSLLAVQKKVVGKR